MPWSRSVGSIACPEILTELFEHLYVLFYQPGVIDIETFLPAPAKHKSLLVQQAISLESFSFGERLLLRRLSGIEGTQDRL